MGVALLPTRDEERELHRQLLAGDKVAVSRLAVDYYEPLLAALRAKARRDVSDDEIADAASETWTTFAKDPTGFDPSRPLLPFLTYMAKRDLDNLVAKRDRRRKREDRSHSVELLPGRGIDPGDGHADDVAHRASASAPSCCRP
jgi:DNA-directed RNA polymerase specialized sigma24 family protein